MKTGKWRKRMAFFDLCSFLLLLFLCLFHQKAESMETDYIQTSAGYKQTTGRIALTFDDGPHEHSTEELLNGLKERKVKVTFFVTGKQAEKYPELIKRMAEEGHLIGNHTYSHIQLRKDNREDFRKELEKTNAILEKLTGKDIMYVRPPYGAWDKKLEKELSMLPVFWNVDPLDWRCNSAECVKERVLSKTGDNSIILLHDQFPSSVKAAFLIVDELQKQGYEFVTVEEMLLD